METFCQERLSTAETALDQAWRTDPSDPIAPTKMLSVAVGAGKSPDEMETWFQRAMKANPDNWDACNAETALLVSTMEYGSTEDMLAFGRECLTNQAWGGTVTLMVVDAHQAIANMSGEGKNYWKRPEVWPDIHAAFEEFFRRNPDEVSHRYNYAWYANVCGDWKVLNEQIPLLGEVNYDYFGGREAYDAMVQRARDGAKQ